MDERLFAHSVGTDQNQRLAAERGHLLHALVQQQLGLVKVQVLAHVVLILALLLARLKSKKIL